MPRTSQRNLPMQSGLAAAQVIRCRVSDTDARRHVVTVVSEQDGKKYTDVPLSSPYYHYLGEGFFFLPEIDSVCMLCLASDDTPPFIMGYLDVPGMMTQEELEQQGGADEQTTATEEAKMSYSGAKPLASIGDMGFIGLDDNFLFLRRGGVVQVGAAAFCQRIFSPVRSSIQDYAENWEVATYGGTMSLESDRPEDSADVDVGAHYRLLMNDKVGDTKGSVMVEAGHVGDTTRLRIVVAPSDIDLSTGAIGEAVISLTLDSDGKVSWVSAEWEHTADSYTLDVSGDADITVGGSHTLSARESSENLTSKSITATNIRLSGNISLAGQISLGGTGMPIVGNAEALQTWLITHQHAPVTGIAFPPPPNIILPNVKG